MKSGVNRWKGLRTSVIAFTALAGLLIWAKLRLVTNFPRTVLADPEQRQVDEPTDQPDPQSKDETPENE